MTTLPVTTTRVELRPARSWRTSRVPGATLRSALLPHLRRLLCVRPGEDCETCPLRRACPYPAFWHPLNGEVPRWWLAVEPQPDQACAVDAPLVVTLGAIGPVPVPHVLLEALLRMARQGLGRDRIRHAVASMRSAANPIVTDDAIVGDWPAPRGLDELVRKAPVGAPSVALRSPHPSTERPTVSDWLGSAIGRLRGLARSIDVRLPVRWPAPDDEPTLAHDLRYVRASRSSRSGGRQSLSGWVGRLGLAEPTAARFGDLLSAVEVVGASRGATFGLGDVQMVPSQTTSTTG